MEVSVPPEGSQQAPNFNDNPPQPSAHPQALNANGLKTLANIFQWWQQNYHPANFKSPVQNSVPQASFAHKASLQPIQHMQTTHLLAPHTQLAKVTLRPRSFNSTFSHNTDKGFDNYKNVFTLKKEIELHFPNVNIRIAYINKADQLVIKASTAQDHAQLQGKWPDKAFKTGIKLINKPTKLFIALINIGQEFDVGDSENKSAMLTNYKITEMTRIQNRKLNQPTRTIQAVCNDYESYEKIITEGKILVGFSSIKARPWNFRQSTNQCFRCCGLGHTQINCTSKALKCLRGAKEHSYKDCNLATETSAYK